MNKKFLSAVLFGALMVSSTGTFVSCKDYDDDIENLQDQINTVVKDLADLKSQIGDKGVTSVSFDEATGVLTVVDGTGTKTYTIKTQAPDVEEVNIKIDGKNLVVNGTVIGEVGDKVTMDGGQLYVNGTATGLKVGEYAILDNQNAGTVTITLPDANGKLQTVELMKASASLSSVQFEGQDPVTFGGFTTGAILWQKSLKANPNWEGSKGAVTKGQLLIGQISTIDVQVTPASYELDGQALTLTDSKGNVAPVIITAVPNNRLMTRAASANGSWTLYAEIDQTKVNTANIKEVFDYDKNITTPLGYALCVNGNPYTAYDIAVDTDIYESTSTQYIQVSTSVSGVKTLNFIDNNGRVKDAKNDKLSVGTTNFYINEPALYDFYLTFEDTNKSLAEQYGIKITEDGRGIIVPAGAEGVQITATVHTMGINGYVLPSTEGGTTLNRFTLNIAGSEVATQTLPETKHVISANNPLAAITVNFGDVFAQFPAAAREAVRQNNAYLAVEGDDTKDGFFISTTTSSVVSSNDNIIDEITTSSSSNGTRGLVLQKADGSAWIYGADDMLDLKKMKLNVTAATLNPEATPGKYTLTFKAIENNGGSAVSGNELIKVTVPVEISTPAFTDLFNYTGNWNDAKNEYTTKLSINSNLQPALLLGGAFTQKATGALDSRIQLLYNLIGNDSPFTSGTEVVTDGVKYIQTTTDQLMELKKSVIYNNVSAPTALKNSELKVKAYYDLFNNTSSVTSSSTFDELREAFAVTSGDITVKLQRALEGITAAYYVDGVATTNVQLLTGNEILAGSGKIGDDAEGLIISLDGKTVNVAYSNWNEVSGTSGSFASAPATPELAGYKLQALFNSRATAVGEIGVKFTDEFNGLNYKWGVCDLNDGVETENVIVDNWSTNLGSTNVVIEFNDATGMTYKMNPITLIKANN